MNISNTPGAIKKFGRTPWKFQTTFVTPLKELDSFVPTILAANQRLESASVTIDTVVFETKHLNTLEGGHSAQGICEGVTITVERPEQVQELLIAAFSDWIDFLFTPTPKPFVIYADHDEYATFYANTRSNLNSVVKPLLEKKFKQVLNWRR